MNKHLISIIVPVYNIEMHIDKCIKSIVDQTYKNLEIILVDDGSTDNCPRMCDEWAKKDSRIKVIHKENGGVSSARNIGLDIGTGSHIMFIDSDDWIFPDYCEIMLASLQKYAADLVCSNISNIFDVGVSEQNTAERIRKDYTVEGNESIIYQCFRQDSLLCTACGKMYAKELIDNIRFDQNLCFGEDTKFIREAAIHAHRIAFITNHGYCYYHHRNSTTVANRKTEKHLHDSLKVGLHFVDLCEKRTDANTKHLHGIHYMLTVHVYGLLCENKFPKKTETEYLSSIKKSARLAKNYKPAIGISCKLKMMLYYYFFPLAKFIRYFRKSK